MQERREIKRGPCELVMPSGERYALEREWHTVDDWRNTALGPVNFGKVTLGPQTLVRVA